MSADAGRRHGILRLAAENGARLSSPADRVAPRYRTFLAGKVRVEDGRFVLCVVRDMSKTGARLVVDPAADLSEAVELHVLAATKCFTARSSGARMISRACSSRHGRRSDRHFA
jgi:hypothetical protein